MVQTSTISYGLGFKEKPPEHFLKNILIMFYSFLIKKNLFEIKCGSIPLILALWRKRRAELGESETSLVYTDFQASQKYKVRPVGGGGMTHIFCLTVILDRKRFNDISYYQ